MIRQIRALTGVRLCNLMGLNEARYCRDKKKKRRAVLTLALYAIISLMAAFYIALMALGLCEAGLGGVFPTALCAVISLVTFFFTFFSCEALFNLEAYEREIALPVKPFHIVASRFIVIYVPNAALSLLCIASGFGVYAFYTAPDWPSYIFAGLGALLTPLIPMIAAFALGALVYGAASLSRHKNLLSIVLALGATLALMILPAAIPDEIDPMALIRLSETVENAVAKAYPIAKWFGAGVSGGDWGNFALFAFASLAIFAAGQALIQWKFADICRSLGARRAGGNFALGAQKRTGVLAALYKKELGRYFASPVYVVNTIIGYVMMLAGAIALAASGAGEVAKFLPGVDILRFLPFILSALCSMTSTTSSAISIEGRQWWIAQTLPVPAKSVFDAKLLVQLTVSLPFYAASCLVITLSLALNAQDAVSLWITPFCYILLTGELGLTLNAAMPVFNWDSETAVVKQSASAGLAILAGLVSVIIPAVIAALLPQASANAVCLTAGGAAAVAAVALRRRVNAVDLSSIGE